MESAFAYANDPNAHRPTLLLAPAQRLFQELLESSLILFDEWEALPSAVRNQLSSVTDPEAMLNQLVEHKLLTEYQVSRLRSGNRAGLVLGNYRVLAVLGVGGMGVVYRAEHVIMRRQVAIKVLPVSAREDPQLLVRFLAEMRAIAQLQHPNIIAALDAGKTRLDEDRILHYFVMEYVAGCHLEEYVRGHGCLTPATACDLIYQVAGALEEAHQHQLVHRDIKPSNIMVTPEMQAKLLDFGLARHFLNRRLTVPGILLGTVDFMSPEQVNDASNVDIRADIYGLGGTLYWCLTRRTPFPEQNDLTQDLIRRLTQPALPVRTWRTDIPVELEAVVSRMLATNPDERYATPQAVMRALLPFLEASTRIARLRPVDSVSAGQTEVVAEGASVRAQRHRVLIVDDEAPNRSFLRLVLESDNIQCGEASNGAEALEAVETEPYDLLILDIDMPVLTGPAVLQKLREMPPCPHLKIIMVSGRATADDMAEMMQAGANDYLSKPFSVVQFRARVQAALEMKDAQDRSDQLNQHLLTTNAELERHLSARDSDLIQTRNALVLTVAKLVEQGTTETGTHLLRMQRYARCLAEAAAAARIYRDQLDSNFIGMLECCVPLHDIGKVALPDHILAKPGKLELDERIIMQSHTTIGADTLQQVAQQHGLAVAFLQMASDIARHHHEHFDGTGYPDNLAGTAIPLAARIVTIGDVYDALRCRRPHRPALTHSLACQLMTDAIIGQFDPALLQVFKQCTDRFERIFCELPD